MKRLAFIILYFLAISFVYPGIPGYHVKQDVIYGHKAGMALTYDVYIPDDSTNGAGIIHIVSAGWKSSYLPSDTAVKYYSPLLKKGYTVFALRHGSSPYFKVTDMVDDVQKGVEYIVSHARDYAVDSSRIGIYGGSAGAQLALMTGMMHEKSPVAAVVAFFAPSDLRHVPVFIKLMYPAIDLDSLQLASVSPIT